MILIKFTGLCRCVCCGIKVPVENLNIAFTVEPGNIAHIRDFKHSLTFGLIFDKILRQNVLKIILVHSEGSCLSSETNHARNSYGKPFYYLKGNVDILFIYKISYKVYKISNKIF